MAGGKDRDPKNWMEIILAWGGMAGVIAAMLWWFAE